MNVPPIGYRPIKSIGKGSFGQVFLAESNETGSPRYAVKMQLLSHRPHIIENERKIFRLIGSSPFCVNLIRDFEHDKTRVFVMELLGLSLHRHLRQAKTLSSFNTVKLGCQLLNALEFLQSKNVVHRDLHASNIMFDINVTTAKIIDFGLSGIEGEKQVDSSIHVAHYSSPNVLLQGQFKFIDDVISLSYALLDARGEKEKYLGSNLEETRTKKEWLLSGKNIYAQFKVSNMFLGDFFMELHHSYTGTLNYESLRQAFKNSILAFDENVPYDVTEVEGSKFLKSEEPELWTSFQKFKTPQFLGIDH